MTSVLLTPERGTLSVCICTPLKVCAHIYLSIKKYVYIYTYMPGKGTLFQSSPSALTHIFNDDVEIFLMCTQDMASCALSFKFLKYVWHP